MGREERRVQGLDYLPEERALINTYFTGTIKNLIRPLIRSCEIFARLQWPVFSREKFTTVTAYRGFVTKSQLLEGLCKVRTGWRRMADGGWRMADRKMRIIK